ncbi:MAG: group I truncated hemoglobin [Kofleriaceae bacterium]
MQLRPWSQFATMLALALSLAAAATGCGDKHKQGATTPAPAEAKLYDRLGGKDSIAAVVDDFLAKVAADARINMYFQNADVAALKTKLVDQICEATGGPCKYTGKSMREVHTNMKITDADFAAMVEDLVQTLDAFQVPAKEQQELLGALGGMKGDIVGL